MANKTISKPATTSTISTDSRKPAAKVVKPKVETKQTAKAPVRASGLATPKAKSKPKEKKVVPPGSVTKSAKKSWQRRPKPAHSGVPVPEKLKKILQQQMQDSDNSF